MHFFVILIPSRDAWSMAEMLWRSVHEYLFIIMQTYSIFSSDDDSESLPDLSPLAGSSLFTDNGNEIELENSVNIPVPMHDNNVTFDRSIIMEDEHSLHEGSSSSDSVDLDDLHENGYIQQYEGVK